VPAALVHGWPGKYIPAPGHPAALVSVHAPVHGWQHAPPLPVGHGLGEHEA
jgi:hypothetical protein